MDDAVCANNHDSAAKIFPNEVPYSEISDELSLWPPLQLIECVEYEFHPIQW